MSQKKSPSPPSLPPDAQREILNRLSAETRISSQEIAAILERHGVCGDIDALQDAYRKRLGQRLMATIRDESGKREVLAASGGEYVIVDCCNDPPKLKAIRHRIQAQMNGLDMSFGCIAPRSGSPASSPMTLSLMKITGARLRRRTGIPSCAIWKQLISMPSHGRSSPEPPMNGPFSAR